jgi:CheY-specific phosphatase CheX
MLTKAIFEVFETMFYVFAEPLREADANQTAYSVGAGIRFSGPVEGAMRISMGNALATLMASNMLNLQDDELTEALTADCLKESLNMICGNFLRKLDPERVFSLSIPEFEAGALTKDDVPTNATLTAVFDTEAGAFEVAVLAPGHFGQGS